MIIDHTKNIIEVKDICFSYGDEEVLRDISFDIHKGDYLGIVGPNGAGKTTTIAKLAHYLKRKGYTCIVAAADTFRAAAIDQLEYLA